MAAPLKTVATTPDLAQTMREIGVKARRAARTLALASTAQKNDALAAMAVAIRAEQAAISTANAEDLAEARKGGMTAAFLDRLTLNAGRIEAMAAGIEA